jgi:hypothetical protein
MQQKGLLGPSLRDMSSSKRALKVSKKKTEYSLAVTLFSKRLSRVLWFFFSVTNLTASINEPFTVQMSDEQLKRKSEQQKAKAPPPGRSRLLSRANRQERNEHNQQLQRKQQHQQQKVPPMNTIARNVEQDRINNKNSEVKPPQTEPQTELKQNVQAHLQSPLQQQQQQQKQQQQLQQQQPIQSSVSEPKDTDDWQNIVEDLCAGKMDYLKTYFLFDAF